jgi:hypothetical protein
MTIKNFDSFNEEFLGIDIKKIKKAAYDFHKTKECRILFSGIDKKILDDSTKEIDKAKEKYGNLDKFSTKLLSKADNKNESIVATTIFTAFGIHAVWKLLRAIKDDKSFWAYLGRLFFTPDSKTDYPFLKSMRDIFISVTFVCYLITYICASNFESNDYYKTSLGQMVNFTFKWDGTSNYIVKDSYDKVYNFIKTPDDKYDILLNGKKIGTSDHYQMIYNLKGEKVTKEYHLREHEQFTVYKMDLERLLTKSSTLKNNKLQIEIQKREKEMEEDNKRINKLSNEIDSLNIKAYENVDMARKFLKEKGLDYDKLMDSHIPLREFRDLLIKNNNIGYLGLFTKIWIKTPSPMYHNLDFLYELYDKIKANKDILSSLRDNNGVKKDIMRFDDYEELNDSLNRLEDWKKINLFIRELPPTQKALIWEDGYFREELKSQYQFLSKTIITISKNKSLLNNFLKKVSSIKTQKNFIDILESLTGEDTWEFEHWLDKLNNTKNVYVTWSDKEKNQIICVVVTHAAIKKIAYMTNWCIFRDKSYFYEYSSKGLQCILYDFNIDSRQNESVIGFTLDNKDSIVNCHNKSDHHSRLPRTFILGSELDKYRGRSSYEVIRKEFMKINLIKAASHVDAVFMKVLKNRVSNFLNRPGIAKFVDFY